MEDLALPEPTVPRKPFSSFKVISYDIYGTLIDWETGVVKGLQPLVSRIPQDSAAAIYRDSRLALAAKYNEIEALLQTEQPSLLYNSLLEQAYLRLATQFSIPVDDTIRSEATVFGSSIGSWPAFPDTVSACQRLIRAGYKLIPVSNVDRESFSHTQAGPLAGVDFFKVYTAQDIGSYKPDLRNFEYLLNHAKTDAGVEKDEILHVAQSLFHDHVPAKKVGLSSVWIARKGAGMGNADGVKEVHDRGEVGYGWRFATLGEFADEVEKERGTL
ncbi:haloacid dehalogenase, type II [Exophiala mesophila]|uniref:Haloacid dehalogenase, type II n=1 Tax=Exophiala mesophila TaxID=212818 RepID=A0A0D1WQL3_EXOME|nr:haloacid dehalogenase, type II [Exophiala mesophila]KIV91390.1 haloacid dehalogenase, type II [Exophiala mesophila]